MFDYVKNLKEEKEKLEKENKELKEMIKGQQEMLKQLQRNTAEYVERIVDLTKENESIWKKLDKVAKLLNDFEEWDILDLFR